MNIQGDRMWGYADKLLTLVMGRKKTRARSVLVICAEEGQGKEEENVKALMELLRGGNSCEF